MNGFGTGHRMEECIHFKGLLKIVTGKRKVEQLQI